MSKYIIYHLHDVLYNFKICVLEKNNILNYFIYNFGTHMQNMSNIHVTKMFMKSQHL